MPILGTGQGGAEPGWKDARTLLTRFREFPRMKRFLLAATAALLLAACADGSQSPAAPAPPQFASGDDWTIFPETMTPTQTVDATGGWEVATRFKASVPGCITAISFYRAQGETGDNIIKVWTNSGTRLFTDTLFATASSAAVWRTVDLAATGGVGPPIDSRICISANTYYRVSVNTNAKQAKTPGYFSTYGSIVRGPLTADNSYYGQPTGTMPTTSSSSIYFIGVTFEES